jgi:hypothetical protein
MKKNYKKSNTGYIKTHLRQEKNIKEKQKKPSKQAFSYNKHTLVTGSRDKKKVSLKSFNFLRHFIL